jgi:hypothetical protein
MVERIGPLAHGDSARLADALAPPPDDSHKWFLSLVVARDCPACERMRADFQHAPALKAWADPDDPSRSWTHWQVFQADDASQAWRWQDVPLSQFPAVIVQPPINRAFGDPHTVVYLRQGYLPPEELSAGIRRAIQRYMAKLPDGRSAPAPKRIPTPWALPEQARTPTQPRLSPASTLAPPTDLPALPASVPAPFSPTTQALIAAQSCLPASAAQEAGQPPEGLSDPAAADDDRDRGEPRSGEWKPPVAPPPRLEPSRLVPNLPPEPAPGLAMLVVQLVTALLSGQGTGNLLLLAILAWQIYRHVAKARGIPLWISDELASQLLAALRNTAPASAAQPPATPQDAARS